MISLCSNNLVSLKDMLHDSPQHSLRLTSTQRKTLNVFSHPSSVEILGISLKGNYLIYKVQVIAFFFNQYFHLSKMPVLLKITELPPGWVSWELTCGGLRHSILFSGWVWSMWLILLAASACSDTKIILFTLFSQ